MVFDCQKSMEFLKSTVENGGELWKCVVFYVVLIKGLQLSPKLYLTVPVNVMMTLELSLMKRLLLYSE